MTRSDPLLQNSYFTRYRLNVGVKFFLNYDVPFTFVD